MSPVSTLCRVMHIAKLRKLQRTHSDSLGAFILHNGVFAGDIREIGANLVSKRG